MEEREECARQLPFLHPPFSPSSLFSLLPFLPSHYLQSLKEEKQFPKRQEDLTNPGIAPSFFLKCHVITINRPQVLDPFGCAALA